MSSTPTKRKPVDSDFRKTKAKVPSPARKSIGEIKVISENHNAEKAKRGCVCKIVGLQGNLAVLFFEKSPGDDAFQKPLKDAMDAGKLRENGFFLFANRRHSLQSNRYMVNQNNTYPRKVFVVTLNENDIPNRLLVMEAACRMMNLPENNTYNIPYYVNEESDVTGDILSKVDEWLLDATVKEVIENIYNNVSYTWASDNPDDASFFFSGPPYCNVAVYGLGYPRPVD